MSGPPNVAPPWFHFRSSFLRPFVFAFHDVAASEASRL